MCSIACLSITTAVLITVIDVGIERPIGDGRIHVAQQLSFTSGFLSVCNIAIAFCEKKPNRLFPYASPSDNLETSEPFLLLRGHL